MIKVKDGYAKLIGTSFIGSADRLLLSNGGDKAVSDFAASSHNHSAADITSGTLPVARGGTGASTFTSGAVLIGNGTGAVTTRSITSSATSGSTALITSGGVYNALAAKMNASITSIELNSSGSLANYGGFIDFHFHDSNKKPLNDAGTIVSSTPDYTSRIIEDAAGRLSVNGVKFKGSAVTAGGGFIGNLTGNAESATNADKLDNIDSTGFMRVISQNSTWSSVETIPTNLTPGVHAVHISGKEYSSILAGNDYTGAQWQLYFHPHASYLSSIKYRYSGATDWKTLLDSSNYSSYALPLTGGTLAASNGNTPLTIKGTASGNDAWIAFHNNSGFLASLGIDSSKNLKLYKDSKSYNVWHDGNATVLASGSVSFSSGAKDNLSHDANAIKSNGVWYYTSNGPTTTLGATTNDGALYSQAYNTSWVAQIAQDYRNGNLFTRGLNNGTWSSWRKVAYADEIVKNTAGSTNTSSKIFLIGATSQAANPQTYSHDTVYVGTDGYLYSNNEKVNMRLTTSLVPLGTAIPASADLNTTTYLKVGKYYCSSNANAATLVNCPVDKAFMMEVYSPLSTTIDNETTNAYVYRLRKITHYNTGVQYIQYVGSGATAGTFTYNSWFVVPRSAFTLDSTDKNSGSAALGSTTQGVYVDSTGTLKAMTYTLGKSVPSNAVFTDTTYSVVGANGTTGLVKNGSSVTSTTGYIACPIVSGVPYYKDSSAEFIGWNRGALNVNALYDAKVDMVASGSNCPTGSQYGVCLTLPYRQFKGNTKPDFGAQIFVPNGDDSTHPNSMLYRTSLGDSWNSWNEVAVKYPTSTITASSTSISLKPETYYTITPSSASTRTFSFASAPSGVAHEYIVEINCSSYAPSIAFPSGIKWINGTAPALIKGKKYVISFVNSLGVFGEF